MKKRHSRRTVRLLSLLFMVIAVFSLAGCESTAIDKEAFKTAEKQQDVNDNLIAMEKWAVDQISYFNSVPDDQIRHDAENAITISDYTNINYPIDPNGMEARTVEMYNSWIKTRPDVGTIQSIDNINVEVGKTTDTLCVITVDTTCELRKCTFEFTISTKYELEGCAINPDFTVGEKLSKAGMNTLIGLGFVFIVLIFISWIISLLKNVNRFGKKAEEQKQTTSEPIVAEEEDEELVGDEELVAVIAAAVAAYEGTAEPSDLVVRSIKKIRRRS